MIKSKSDSIVAYIEAKLVEKFFAEENKGMTRFFGKITSQIFPN